METTTASMPWIPEHMAAFPASADKLEAGRMVFRFAAHEIK